MPNGKGCPDCHNCNYHSFVDVDLAKPDDTIPHDMPGRFTSTASTVPFCSFWNVALPILNTECRVCSDYWAPGEKRLDKEFFDFFGLEPRHGMLYRYFYNDTWMKECMALDRPVTPSTDI